LASAPDPLVPRPRGARAWVDALAVYRDPRLLAIFAMGFASGLPLPLTTTTLAYWLARDGLDRTSIGLFALVGLPYSLKFVWAPLLDHWAPPGLASLGRRRGWILVLQAALVASIAALGVADPKTAPLATAAVVLALAFFSATQDVVVDAYRIEILEDREQGAGAAATQAGYRAGMLASGAGALALSDFVAWSETYAALACLVAAAMLCVVFSPEPPRRDAAAIGAGERETLARGLLRAYVDPLRDVLRWTRWPLVLAFALLYKVGDSIAGAMSNPFYVELGFSGVEIGSLTKVVGLAASVAGILAGGVLVARTAIRPALVLGGFLQAATNLLYVWLAQAGHDLSVLAFAIVADGFTGGVASAAFVAYLSTLCRGAWSGTQYALLTSLMASGRTLIASSSGWLATQLGWGAFFAWTAAFALPGLLLLAALPEPGGRTEGPDPSRPPPRV